MTPGKLLSEIQVGGGSNGLYGLDRRAYEDQNAINDPVIDEDYWKLRLQPESYASGTIIRYPFGLNANFRFSPRHVNPGKHDGYFENTFDQPFLFSIAEGAAWGQAMFEEAHRAALNDIPVYWYHGKPGIGLYDSLALDIVKALPGTHIVDATNGADGRPEWMRKDWWGEAWPKDSDECHGAYCFARNLRMTGGAYRFTTAIYDIKTYGVGRIISCHEPADFEWLLGTTVTKLVNGPADMPTWEILLKSGISLAFRGDEEKVNADLGGRLAEMKETAG